MFLPIIPDTFARMFHITILTWIFWPFLRFELDEIVLYIPPKDTEFIESLGLFVKFRRATVNFVMSVCPSTWNKSAPTGWIFMKFDI
jgi:hypothetical protein